MECRYSRYFGRGNGIFFQQAYWLGPLLGAAFAALIYEHMFAVNASMAKLKSYLTAYNYDDDDFDEYGRIPQEQQLNTDADQ